MLNEQIDEITEEDLQSSKRAALNGSAIKELWSGRKKSLQVKTQKSCKPTISKDDVVTFEQLGVDRLYVDEAHSYKN